MQEIATIATPDTLLVWHRSLIGKQYDGSTRRGPDVLREHGLEPAPDRLKKTTWAEFLKAHWEVRAAADFFTLDVWTRRGLTRFAVLFLIDLSTRRIHIAGIAPEPDSAWMDQIGRNLTDVGDGFLTGKRFLIHDRDPGLRRPSERRSPPPPYR